MTPTEALNKHPLFSWLSNEPLQWLAHHGKTVHFTDGQTVHEAGTPGREVGIVLQGNLEFIPSANSDAIDTLVLDPGAAYGECSLIELRHRTAVSRARGSLQIFVLSHETLGDFAAQFPDPYSIIITNLSRDLARRIRVLNEKKSNKPQSSASTSSTAPEASSPSPSEPSPAPKPVAPASLVKPTAKSDAIITASPRSQPELFPSAPPAPPQAPSVVKPAL